MEALYSAVESKKWQVFDSLIMKRLGNLIKPHKNSIIDHNTSDPFEEYSIGNKQARTIPDIEDMVDTQGKPLNNQPAYNQMLNSEVMLHLDSEMSIGRVTQRGTGPDGKPGN